MATRTAFNLTGPLTTISVMLLLVGFFTAWFVHQSQAQMTATVADALTLAMQANLFDSDIRHVRTELVEYTISGNSATLKTARELLDEAKTASGKLEQLDQQPEQSGLNHLSGAFAEFLHEFRQLSSGVQGSGLQQKIDELVKSRLAAIIIPASSRYEEFQRVWLEQQNDQMARSADRVSMALLLLVMVGAVSGLTAGLSAAKRLRRSLSDMKLSINAVAGSLNEVIGPFVVPDQGELEHLQASLSTITDHVAATVVRLQKAQAQVLRSEQMTALGTLAAGLAHEIRNPLTSMQMIVQSVKEQGASSMTARDLDVLDEEITRLNGQVQTFLDFARPPKLEHQPVSISELIHKATGLVSRSAKQRGITVHVEMEEGIGPLLGDRNQLQQVLLNLLINAIEAQPSGGRITLEVKKVLDEVTEGQGEKMLQVRVIDEGIGISEQIAERIFEPFFSTKEAGTGIGLAISRRIIESHGGELEYESLPRGCSFRIRMPCQPALTRRGVDLYEPVEGARA